jgi:arsenite oxidase small subunit
MKDCKRSFPVSVVSITRRNFIRIGCTTLSGPVIAGMSPALAAAAAGTSSAEAYPILDVAPLADIKPDATIRFTYPDADSPSILVRLRQPAAGGVGPDNAIVAFSILCTHKGCPVAYRADRKLFICPCHWSSFDPTKSGQMVIGQGSQALPQITLRVVGGVVQAVGVTGLIYGRETNVL